MRTLETLQLLSEGFCGHVAANKSARVSTHVSKTATVMARSSVAVASLLLHSSPSWALASFFWNRRAETVQWSMPEQLRTVSFFRGGRASLMTARHLVVGSEHLLPRTSSIHLYLGDCLLEIPSRRIKAKFMVTTSNQKMVVMADFGDDLEIERDVLAAKRFYQDDNTSGERDGTSGASASAEGAAEAVAQEGKTLRSLPQANTAKK